MKILLAQLNYHVGNFDANAKKIIDCIEKGKTLGADIVVFSELAVCGYIPHDMLEQRDFIDRALKSAEVIAAHCHGIAAIVGCPTLNEGSKGKHLFNSALFMNDGAIIHRVNKTLLPTYDIFDEYRYFEPNDRFAPVEFMGKRIALTICEDLWDEQETYSGFVNESLYKLSPLKELSRMGADLVINIAGSPFSYDQSDLRRNILIRNAEKYSLPIVYVNQVGAQTEIVFDGGSLALNAGGKVVQELKYFDEDIRLVDFGQIAGMPEVQSRIQPKAEKIHDALITGIRDYFAKMNFKNAVLGMSGGIDSALTLALAAEALGNHRVHCLMMPSMYSSEHSISDSLAMVQRLGVSSDIIPISNIYNESLKTLTPFFKTEEAGLTGENLQARIRGNLLMAYSNKFGHIVLNTSNKSEAATGYGTLYGDMCGAISVLGDVYKTDVYALARFMNRNNEVIPLNIITKAPSAELRPDQKDSDSLPEYDTLDTILFGYIEQKKTASELIAEGYNPETVNKTIRLVNANEFKRFQAPPVIRVSSKAFGFGRRIPLVARY